jgi:hypothetical protein
VTGPTVEDWERRYRRLEETDRVIIEAAARALAKAEATVDELKAAVGRPAEGQGTQAP